jgi:hypothetical protein
MEMRVIKLNNQSMEMYGIAEKEDDMLESASLDPLSVSAIHHSSQNHNGLNQKSSPRLPITKSSPKMNKLDHIIVSLNHYDLASQEELAITQ